MKLWKTSNGNELNPDNMTTSHIKNCINMLKRKGFVSSRTVSFYTTCAAPHGDMAMDCFDRECDYIFNAPISKFLDIFEDILKERGEL